MDSTSSVGGVGSGGPGDTNLDPNFFEDRDSPKVKIPCTNNLSQKQDDSVLPSVSVQIVQQISAQQDQTIQTNVTVSSTVKGSAASNQASGSAQPAPSANIHTSTNIECKQEPQDNPCNYPSNLNPFGIDDVDELQAILETLEREEGEIPPDLIKELDKLGEPCDSVNSVGSDPDQDADFKDQLFGTGSGKGSPNMFGDPSTPLGFDGSGQPRDGVSNQNMANMNQQFNQTNQNPVGGNQPASGILNMAEPTGPAAETLKQMAAQHQIPENGMSFGMKQTMSYTSENVGEGYPPAAAPPRGQAAMQTPVSAAYPRSYPANPQTMQHHAGGQQDGMYAYNQQQQQQQQQQAPQPQVRVPGPNHHQPVSRMVRPGMERPPVPHMPMPPMHIKQDPSLNYGANKPLSHYTHNQMHPDPMASQQNPPSSLQQLQEQVHSHFPQGSNPGPNPQQQQPSQNQQSRIQLTQNQEIQMSQARGHIQMSQRQQLQMHAGPTGPQGHQMTLSQQQSFSMSQQAIPGRGPPPNNQSQSVYMNEQMKMQMMRQQRLREQQQMMEQRQAQMQGYMNRPPPEYKIGTARGTPSTDPSTYPQSTMGGSSNPLQTMQNMVNQTSQVQPQIASSQNAMYSMIKQESNQPMPGQGMESPAVDRGGRLMGPHVVNNSHPVPGRMPQSMPSQQQPPVDMGQSFPQRQPPLYQGQTMSNSTMHSQVKMAGTPAYTSAIMRGQRPPNVNVGPEGLNISQQRPHSSEWPRSAMMQQSNANQQMGRVPMPRSMAPNQMMQYSGYPVGQPSGAMGMTNMPMQGHPHQRQGPGHVMVPPPQSQMGHAQDRTMMQQQAMVQERTMMQQSHAQQDRTMMAQQNHNQQERTMMAQQQQQQQQQGHLQERTMMQQQQQMQEMRMRHQNAHGQITNVNMSQSVSMTTRTAQEFPANSAAGATDFPLDFLDGPQAGSTDFFDSNAADLNFIEEIFGK